MNSNAIAKIYRTQNALVEMDAILSVVGNRPKPNMGI